MSAADSLGVRGAAAASRAARAGAESHAETQGGGSRASGFLDVLSDLAEQRRDLPPEPVAEAAAAAKAGLLEAVLRHLASTDGGERGPSEPVPDRQDPAADEAPPIRLSPSLAEIAAVLSAPVPRLSAPAADAGSGPRGCDAEPVARPQANLNAPMVEARQGPELEGVAASAKVPVAAAASTLRVLECETHLAPATGTGVVLERAATPTPTSVASSGAHEPAPATAADEEASPPHDGLGAKGTLAKDARLLPSMRAGDPAASRPPQPVREQQTEPIPAAAADAEAEGKSPAGAAPLPAVAEARTHGASAAALGPISPLRQLAQHIAAETVPGDSGVDSAVTRDKLPVPSVLRVLSIQLQPLELGTVSVRMTLRNDALAVEITADRQETARLLQQDREALFRLLQASGFATDSIQVLSRPADAPSPGAAHGWPQFSQQQAGAGFAQPDARSFGKQGQAGREQKPPNTSRKGDDEISSARAGGSLYV